MKTIVEDVSSVKKKLIVSIEAEEVDRKVNEAYGKFGKTAKVSGFRKGKVPRKILERYYGEQVLEDVTNSLVRETLPKAMEETKTFPLDMPVVENEILKSGQIYNYSAVMEVKPEFELKDYTGIEVEKELCSVTDEDVDKQLEEIREASGNLVSMDDDRGIRENDRVVIDYDGFDQGTAVEGAMARNFSLRIGRNEFYPGVEDALIGLRKGDTTEITVDFKDDYYNSRMADKSIDFKIVINDIKVMELPELDDNFASGLSEEFKDLEELTTRIREDLIKQEEARIDKELKERIVKKISDSVDFELPECLVEPEINTAIENVRQNLKRAGSSFEKAGLDEEKLRGDFRPVSEKMVKGMLILGEIARQNDLTISEEDEAEGFTRMGASIGQDPQMLRKYHEANNRMDSFRQTLLKEKTLNYLVEKAMITVVAADGINDN